MKKSEKIKPLIWVGSTLKEIQKFPLEVQDVVGLALLHAQYGGKHPDAKPLKGFGGAGTLEVIEDYQGDTFRAVYTVRFKDIVYGLDAFQKKSKKGRKTPKEDINRIKRRLKMAEGHYSAYSARDEHHE